MNKRVQRKIIAIAPPCLVGWLFTFLATNVFISYAFGLFIWLPIIMGAMTTLIFGYKNETNKTEQRRLAFMMLAVFYVGLLFFAFEGVICIIMSLPEALFFVWVGHLTAFEIMKRSNNTSLPTSLSLLILSLPALMGFEYVSDKSAKQEEAHPVVTSVEINAPVETVWKNVVAFPQLPEPTEFIFKTGIAYPINAKITGQGVGAIRYCNFSTGSFVEPITLWDEPRLLKFDVAEQPEAMQELSFYDLHPNHLHGYFVSKKGQFKLTALPNSKTILEGTTWYYNKIKPIAYWNLWSDAIIHKIHGRVLAHIKTVSEAKN